MHTTLLATFFDTRAYDKSGFFDNFFPRGFSVKFGLLLVFVWVMSSIGCLCHLSPFYCSLFAGIQDEAVLEYAQPRKPAVWSFCTYR